MKTLFLCLILLFIQVSLAESESDSSNGYQRSRRQVRRRRRWSGWARRAPATTTSTTTTTTTTTTTSPPPNPNTPIPAQHYKDGLWIALGGGYNSFFMCTGNGVIVMDAPTAWGDRLIPTIQKSCPNEKITHLVYSHHHSDHIGAAPVYKALNPQLSVVCQEIVNQKVTLNWGFNPLGRKPSCDQTFYNQMSLSVGNQTVSLEYLGPAHSAGNTFIYAAKQKVLMFIDIVFTDYLPFRSLAVAEDIPAFGDAHNWILNYFNFDILVSGHVDRVATRADVELGLQFFNDLKAAAQKALATVNFNNVVSQASGDSWARTKAWEYAVRDECVKTMTPKWGSKPGVAYLPSQCLAMQTAVRVD